MVERVKPGLRRVLASAARGSSVPIADVFCFALGAILTKDMLTSLVYWGALARPQTFLWPYVALPRIPWGGTGIWMSLVLQSAALLGAFLLLAGVARRAAALLVLSIYGYGFLGNRLAYTNNQYVLLVCLAAAALIAGRERPLVWLGERGLRLFISSIYLTAGVTKLTAAWFSGEVLREALYSYQGVYARWIDVDSPLLFRVLAVAAVLTELLLAVGLWVPRLRWLAIVAGVGLHASIELLMPVRVFSYLMITSYLLCLDAPSRRRISAVIGEVPAWARPLVGLGGAWLLNRFFWRFTANYSVTEASDWPLCLAAVACLAITLALGPDDRSPPRGPVRLLPRGPAWLLVALGVAQAAALVRPALGGAADFSFRIFTGVLLVRVEAQGLSAGRWRPIPLLGSEGRWASDEPRHSWWTWTDERLALTAYARWLLRARPDLDAVRLTSEHSQDGAPLVTEVFEAPSAAP
jgi:hypothetical protein